MDEAQERNLRAIVERSTSDLVQSGMNILVAIMWYDYMNRQTADNRQDSYSFVKQMWEEKINSRRIVERAVIEKSDAIPAEEKPAMLQLIDSAFAKANELFGEIVCPETPKTKTE